eukprot:TRINITY_DN23196_c0_g1_i1.p1 TRINITY_DN23196_c0_g1~~TRINITY_DN23196_c0_g1_i1.p1  ORF type:complete len:778 (-),score=127.48 TRINITY_DN23196_c0_g1_i1:3-2336(-)
MYAATVQLGSQIGLAEECSQDQQVLTVKLANERHDMGPVEDCLPGCQVLHLGRDRGYTSEQLIGRGSFGAALLVCDAQGKECVIKAVDLSSLRPKLREDAHLEPEIMQRLKHPYIVRYRESFLEKGMLAIVMDYAGGGDLLQRVEAAREQHIMLPDHQVRTWIVQALLGTQYLHSLSVIHRDLKNENLFLENFDHLRIGDFGLARVLSSPSGVSNEEQIVGTPYYWSPEICSEGVYSTASDMWALGCVLYELLSLGVPFDAEDLPSLLVKVAGPGKVPSLPAKCSRRLADLCASLLIKDLTERPSAGEILERPIVQQVMSSLRRQAIDAKQLEIHEMLSQVSTTPRRTETADIVSTAKKSTSSTADTCAPSAKQWAMQLSNSACAPGGKEIVCCDAQEQNLLDVVKLEIAEPASEGAEVVHSTKERVPPVSSQAQRESCSRSLSPDVAYRHQLLLSKSGARAAGTPLQWLREQRQERSDCNLHVQDQQIFTKAEKPESWVEKLHLIPKLQLGSVKALSEADVLSAALLPPSDWTSVSQHDGAASQRGAATSRAAPKKVVRSKSSSALSSARVESSRERTNISRLRCPGKPQVLPFALGLERIREEQAGGKVHGPAAPRGFPLKVCDRAKSSARNPSSRVDKDHAPSSACMGLPWRAPSFQRRDASKDRRQQHAPLRTAVKAGFLLQNVGVAVRAPQTSAAQACNAPQSWRGQKQEHSNFVQQMGLYGPSKFNLGFQAIPIQRANSGTGKEPGALTGNRSAPSELRSARARSKPRNVL